jgi:hypothetical protein
MQASRQEQRRLPPWCALRRRVQYRLEAPRSTPDIFSAASAAYRRRVGCKLLSYMDASLNARSTALMRVW